MDLPRYSTGRGPEDLALDIVPPFLFPGTTMRVFPLKANMFRLRHFCETYLNLMPPTIARFRPALPFVYLMVLDYGRMAVEEANLGWISQHEVTFSVPLEWHRQRADGRWELVDQVYVSPFIFVDSPMSLSTGREVYGWSKLRVELSPGIHSWISDPRGPQRLLSLRIKDLPGMPRSTLLAEIVSEPPPNPSLVPPDLSNAWNPLVSIPQTLLGSWRIFQDFLDVSAALPIRGYAADNPLTFFERLLRSGRKNNPLQSLSSSGIVTLKQFRDAEDPAYACYQALVHSEMTTRRFNRGGLLGDLNLLRGDWTGGYRVRIHHLSQLPILESLGLEVAREVGFESSYAATLRPVFPFWLDLDLEYGRGRTVCWRTRSSTAWKTAQGVPFPGAPQGNATSSGNLYNTIQGSAVLPGPFVAPQGVMHAFPLKADRERLGRFIDTYLDLDGLLDEHGRPILVFEGLPADAEVYLVASSSTSFAESASLGSMTSREMGLYIPVLVREGGKREVQVALLAPFIFSDNSMFAIADREMIGQTMAEATLEGAPDAWLPGPPVPRTLLQVTTDVFLGLGLGLGAERRVLLEIVESGQPPSRESAGPIPPEETASVARQLSRNVIILKQFRDAERPSLACFQSIVSVEQVGEVLAAGRVPDNVYVRIHRYPSHPIAEMLGLIPDPSLDPADASAGLTVQSFRPRRAVWAQVSLRIGNRREVCWRAGSKAWSRRPGELLFLDDAGQQEVETPAALEPDAKASPAPQPAAAAQAPAGYIEFTWGQQLPAPYTFKDVRLRGFTLAASYGRLAQLCDKFLNFDGLHYQPFPTLLPGLSVVYLQALTYGSCRSLVPPYEQSGFVQYEEIYFTIPVFDLQSGDYGLFTPIIFVSNPWPMTAGREVLGFPKGLGRFELPMDVDHPYPIRVETMAFQEFHPGTRLSWGPFLEIADRPGLLAAAEELDPRNLWPFGDLRKLHGDRGPLPMKKEYFQMLEEVARSMSYSEIQLKQIRGVLASKAAYQKVVRTTVKLTALDDGGLLPPASVRLFETATLPTAEILGLHVKDGFVEPYVPFWVDCSFDALDPVVLER